MASEDPQLAVRNLCVDYVTDVGPVRAVDNVSFEIGRGEIFGLAGESGCGKSTVAFAVTRLTKPPATIAGGEVLLGGENVLDFTGRRLQQYRWGEVSMVFQSAMNALNPVLNLEEQFRDVLQTHTRLTRRQARLRAQELLELVDIHPNRLRDYPHQFSGGMRQRLVIAIALALNPKLIIMDEPTTALDVVVQREILQKIHALKEEFGFSILFITHDLSLMVEFTDRIGVMYAGQIIESAPSLAVLEKPLHPYTEGLRNSFPSLTAPKQRLTGIPGSPLNLREVPPGCRFQARCPQAFDACFREPTVLADVEPGHYSRCHLHTRAHEQPSPEIFQRERVG
ncbi:ABC transporter ATP-binding protein [Arhodomonas sp. AD133]|uniref:ABC transporter ATP-binding protein n=1 Tax=Arhodomonas sp. AD133 TaxID=3415009 RepID=UPI003EBE0788